MKKKVEIQVQLLCDPTGPVWVVAYRLWSNVWSEPLTAMTTISPQFPTRKEAAAWRDDKFGYNCDIAADHFLSN